MAKVTWRGHKFDPQTAEMLRELDKLVGPYVSIQPTQGSYSNSVGASAGTHSGAGACDLSVQKLSSWQVQLVVFLARRIGFAAWHRSSSEGPWADHIHLINKTAKGLAPAAERQVAAYKAKRNGLANDKADKHKALEAPYESTWATYLNNWSERDADQ